MGILFIINVKVKAASPGSSYLEGLVHRLKQIFMGRLSHVSQNTQTFVPHVFSEERALLLEDLAEDDADKSR